MLGDWVGVDLTRMARRELGRGHQHLEITKLKSSAFLHKYAFIEIIKRAAEQVSTIYRKHNLTLNLQEKRTKQSDLEGVCSKGETSCCLSSMQVNLTDLGWGFVISL